MKLFIMLTLPMGALNKILNKIILRWNAIFVPNIMKANHLKTKSDKVYSFHNGNKRISFCKMVDFMEKYWIVVVSVA